MERIFDYVDWMSIKMTGISLVLAGITGGNIAMFFAVLASISTIAYNAYRFFNDRKKNK